MNLRTAFATALLLASSVAAGDTVRPFVASSLAEIVAAREGRAFVLAFWSVSCTHCPVELRALGERRQRNPKLDVVLVSADTPADAPEAARLAAHYGLASAEQWVFADAVPERLRAAIDRRWHGELPRTYFYARDHRVDAVSGIVPPAALDAWIRDNVR